jgi:hypothetical protein
VRVSYANELLDLVVTATDSVLIVS